MTKQDMLKILDDMEKETESNIGFVMGHVTKDSILEMIRRKKKEVESMKESIE